MALFNKSELTIDKTFNKKEVMEDILDLLASEFSAYKVITSKDDPWDLLIIRMVNPSVVFKLGTMGMHESVRECVYQEIFAINVMSPDEDISNIDEYAKGWTKAHIVLSDARTLRRKLMEKQT